MPTLSPHTETVSQTLFDEKPTRLVQSVDRALAILDTLARARGGLSLMNLSQRMGMNVSTCHHLLRTLAHRGYVAQDPRTREYRLGNKLFELSYTQTEHIDLINRAMPHLQELNAITDEAVHLAVLVADELVTLIKLESTHAIKVDSGTMGKSNAAHATATGKALLAFLSDAELGAIIARKGLTRFTDRTLCTSEALRKDLEGVRRDGHSEDREEFQLLVYCVGAPIRDHTGRVIASVSCASPIMRMNDAKLARVRTLVMNTAMHVSRDLGSPLT